jgi:hypothetical protein
MPTPWQTELWQKPLPQPGSIVTADITDDLQFVDGLIGMTLRVLGSVDLSLLAVLDMPPTAREMEASGGQVVSTDRRFTWALKEAGEPALGSFLIDDDGVMWKVYSTTLQKQVGQVEALCRNIEIRDIPQNKATILKARKYRKGRAGEAVPKWDTIAVDVPARFQPAAQTGALLAGGEWSKNTFRVILGISVPMELAGNEYRLVDYQGNRYRINEYIDAERIDLLPVAIVTECA